MPETLRTVNWPAVISSVGVAVALYVAAVLPLERNAAALAAAVVIKDDRILDLTVRMTRLEERDRLRASICAEPQK